MTETTHNRDVARDLFWRYHEVFYRGHDAYMKWARRLEDMYLGGGRQWRESDRRMLESEGRPCREVNTILPTVNAAAGYQIQNRVDIAYLPRGQGADEQIAKVMSKVVRHSLDNTQFRWHETDMFLDGLIQQRGYLDLRMCYDDSIDGEPKLSSLDPLDVLPDPDARSYDTDEWSDVRVTRWMTAREIEGRWGKDAADAVVQSGVVYADENFGHEVVHRTGFGNLPFSYAMGWGWFEDRAQQRRYRIIDEQSHEYANTLVGIWPTGDFRSVEDLPREKLAWLIDHGVHIVKRRIRRVRWRVAAPEVCFLDKLSPYQHFTVIPYFPYFRRGRTIGMVDNMVSPTEMLNKFVSQYEHVINSSANSGWQAEAESFENMTDDEFVERGAETGLVMLRKPGKPAAEKIQPNQVPNGVDKMIQWSHDHLNIVSGVDKSLREPEKQDLSGVAIQALQYAGQQKLAIVLDNLSKTRHMVGKRVLEMVQRYMGNERVIRITEIDSYGVESQVPLPLNVRMPDGTVFNDLTVGEYDMVVNEKPATVTFDHSEFEQMKAMRAEMGIPIPDPMVVKASTLSDKSEIAEALRENADKGDPNSEAEIALKLALARKADNDAVAKAIEAQYSAIQTATAIVMTPEAAALADALLRSGGFKDQDAAPIVPAAPAGIEPAMPDDGIPTNTNPLTPANPGVGLTRGLSDAPDQPPV